MLNRIRERHGFEHFDDKLFPGIRLLHADPVVFEVDGFFTPQECSAYVAMSTLKQSGRRKGGLEPMELQSATTNSQFQQQRTSTTWFHAYASAPELIAKASLLLGVDDFKKWEEPQTVRYRPGERFNWHLDALPPSECGASKGGQRTATVLVSEIHAVWGCISPHRWWTRRTKFEHFSRVSTTSESNVYRKAMVGSKIRLIDLVLGH